MIKIHSSIETNLFINNKTKPHEKYYILSNLNTGAFGSSYLIRDLLDEQIYILKRINKDIPKQFRKYVLQERYLLNYIKSNFILSLISSYIDIEHRCYSTKFEYISGITLLHLLRKYRWFNESTVAFYSSQIVLVFEYLHDLNIIYRNLKLETILIAQNGYIKLCDFAFAKRLSTHDDLTYTIIGVPDTIPPEMLLGQSYSYSVDWWQLGISMFEMLTSHTPFYSRSMLKTHENVIRNNRCSFPSHVSILARDTCRKFLEFNVKKRLGCSKINRMNGREIKENIWFNHHIKWTAIIEQSQPAPYKPKDMFLNTNNNVSIMNTIESKWLTEYDQDENDLKYW